MRCSGNLAGPNGRLVRIWHRRRQSIEGGKTRVHRNRQLAVLLLVGLTMLLGSVGPPAPVIAAGATPTANCRATTPEENLATVRSFYEEGVNGADLSVFDRVAVALRYSVEGVHTGEFRGLAPSGKTITWNHSTFAHVACGRISEMWAEIDQLDRLQEFGILAAAGPAARMAGAASSPVATSVVPAESASCAPQSPEETIAVVDRARTEVYNARNFDVMPDLFAEGYLHGSANGPDAIGIAAGAQRIGGFVTALPDLEWTFDEVIAEGDRVAARWTMRGTHNGDLLGFAPTGKPVEFTGISFFTVRCGKIVESQTEMDADGLLEQVGAPVRSD